MEEHRWLRLQRQLRVLAILAAAERGGLAPLALSRFHTIAYLADAMAPVWGLQILEAQLLKQEAGPMSPLLQRDVDALVGIGVLRAQHLRHVRSTSGRWRLDADYGINHHLADPIIAAASEFASQAEHFEFVEEVVFAVAALSNDEIEKASLGDEAYADPIVDLNSLLDLVSGGVDANRSARLAFRFIEIMSPQAQLSSAEATHLYLRHVQERLHNAP